MRCVIYLRVSTKEQAEKDLTEEGFSIPAQREACVRHVRDQGWTVVDEYSDRGESARTVDRPQLQAMLARIIEERDVDAVVVHKIDRLARNVEDHVAIRAALRRSNATLVSVTEKIEATASGRLVEGIHALMAEFYSANLATEIKKGMTQKAKMGGFPQVAPVGYLNVREIIGGRQVAHIVPDPDRAPLVQLAFELYATGEFTLDHLLDELAKRGLTNRARRNHSSRPLSVHGIQQLLTNKLYSGIVCWNGVESQGTHEPLVPMDLFTQVQDVMATRAGGGTRERKHRHHLKGSLACGVCGRRLSLQLSKGRYLYFFCLGMRDRKKPTGCREPHTPVDTLERQVEAMYQRIELPAEWVEQLQAEMEAEVISRQSRNATERTSLAKQLIQVESERRKLLDAYYANAIEVATLRTEQDRIGREARRIEERLATVDASLEEWQEVLSVAIRFASDCGAAYARADDRTRHLYNQAIFEDLLVREGKVAEARFRAPFDLLFSSPEFYYGGLVERGGLEPPTSAVRGQRSPS